MNTKNYHLLISSRLRWICLARSLTLYGPVPISGRAGTIAMGIWGEESIEFSSRPNHVTRCTLYKAVKQGERRWQRKSGTHFLPFIQ